MALVTCPCACRQRRLAQSLPCPRSWLAEIYRKNAACWLRPGCGINRAVSLNNPEVDFWFEISSLVGWLPCPANYFCLVLPKRLCLSPLCIFWAIPCIARQFSQHFSVTVICGRTPTWSELCKHFSDLWGKYFLPALHNHGSGALNKAGYDFYRKTCNPVSLLLKVQ